MARLLREQCQSKTGAPTEKYEKYFVDQSKLGGPQQREMRKAFHQAKQVVVEPRQIGFRKESQRTKQVGVAETAP